MSTIRDAVEEAYREMGECVFTEEPLSVFLADAQSLLVRHWSEIATHGDIALNVDEDAYRVAEANGRLCIISARAAGRLVGYAVFFLIPSPHYRLSLQAMQDVFYLHPAMRGLSIGSELLRSADRILKAKGCQVVHHHVKHAHPALGHVLAKSGYRPVETIYEKRLDREES